MAVLAGLAVTAGVAVLLVAAVGRRDAAQPISGDGSAIGLGTSSLSFFQERVRLHPEDVAARLLRLPFHNSLSEADLGRVVGAVTSFSAIASHP